MTQKKHTCSKKKYQKLSFELKLSIIDQIHNGRISVNHAANKYLVSRSSINYWMNKYSNMENKSNSRSKNDEIKKLKQKIEELEFIKEFQQDLILEFESVTGLDFAKKSLPDSLKKELDKKRQNPSK